MQRFLHLILPFLLAIQMIGMNAVRAQSTYFMTGDDKQPYFAFAIDQDLLSGAPDQSQLNSPITPADKIFVRNGHFYRVGHDLKAGTSDDTRVRLYGINLSFATNFPNQQDAIKIAKRLRKLGFNAVRLHHMDTAPGVQDNPPRSLLTPGPYPSFNDTAISRLAYFIRALGNEGIYVNLNLEVAYPFPAAINQFPKYEQNKDDKTYGSPVHVYYPRMVTLQEQFARELLQRLNLKDYPGLAMVEISNESSLLAAWQRKEWKQAVPPNYEPTLLALWQTWIRQHYGSIENACKAWGKCTLVDQQVPLMSPTDQSVLPDSLLGQWTERAQRKLRPLVNRLMGPSDPADVPDTPYTRRQHDFLHFLSDTDRTYFNRIRNVVHQQTSPLMPVTGTQMGYGGVMNFGSHADMDYIDEHFYIDHPDFPGASWDQYDWRIRNTDLTQEEMRRVLALSFRRDMTKPFVISEYNLPFPNRHSALIQPLMAAMAAQQDWDGLFFFDYMDGDTWADTPAGFTLSGDLGKFALTGQSALLYRHALLPALKNYIKVPLPEKARLAIAGKNEWQGYETYLKEAFNITPELAMQARIGIDIQGKGTLQQAPTLNLPWQSSTQGLVYDTQHILSLNTPNIAGVFGNIPESGVQTASNIRVQYLGKGHRHVALLVSSLEQAPLQQSSRMLLTLSTGITGTQPGSLPSRPKELIRYRKDKEWWTLEPDPNNLSKPSGVRDVHGPIWVEQSDLLVTLPGKTTVTVFPLNGAGERRAALPPAQVQYHANGSTTIHLQATPEQSSLWYEIIREPDNRP